MPTTRRPALDLNQLAKRMLDEATGDAPKTKPAPSKKPDGGRKPTTGPAAKKRQAPSR